MIQTQECNVPALRFPEFSGEWNNSLLGQLFPKIRNGFVGTATPYYQKIGVKYLQGKNIKAGEIDPKGMIRVSKEFHNWQKKSQLKIDDILMVQSGHVGECAVVTPEYEDANCHALVVLSPNKQVCSTFVRNLFYASTGRRLILRIKTCNTIAHILTSDLKRLRIDLPDTLPEQQKIAAFLSSVDRKIAQLGQKKVLLQRYKKGMMQKLFSQELRFKDAQGHDFPDWEEKRLGELGQVSMCKRIMKDETKPSGEVPFFKIGTFGRKPDAFIARALFDSYRKKYSFPSKGDILISAAGTIGRLVVFDGKAAYFQDSNIVWIANDESTVSNAFLLYCYKNVRWTTENTTIPRLYNENLRNIRISAPSLPEQQKIADFLSSIDRKIDLVSTELDHAKTFKKGLLQQMFI